MGILTLQKQGRQIGELRIGMQVPTKNGKMRPAKLDAFRFTTKSPTIAQRVAEMFGKEANQIELLNSEPTWEVVTDVTELPVMVPPGEAVIDQWFRMYTAAGCQRKCDGVTEQLSQSPCLCPADIAERQEQAGKGKACRPSTTLRVMLPDLPDLGVWKLTSNGFYAAVELGGAAELLSRARDANIILPAKLRIEPRTIKKVGESTFKFSVPVLEIDMTLRDMVGLAAGQGLAAALPEAPVQAIEAAKKEISSSARVEAEVEEPTENLRAFILESLTSQEREALTAPVWKSQFAFSSTAVPLSSVGEAKAFILSFKTKEQTTIEDQEEIVDAEIVEDETVATEAPGSESWVDLLQKTFREQGITGPGRWDKVYDITGNKPERWSDVTEWMAEDVMKELFPHTKTA